MKRNEDLIVTIACFAIAAWCLLYMFGCSFVALQPTCLDSTLLAAKTFRDRGYEVRLGYGAYGDEKHIQAQALIYDTWEWLKVDQVYTWRKDNFEVKRYMSIEEARAYWRK